MQEDISADLPSFLYSVFEPSGKKQPVFKSDVRVENGRLIYAE